MRGRHGEVHCVDCDQPWSAHLTVKARDQRGNERVLQTYCCPVYHLARRFNAGDLARNTAAVQERLSK